MHASNNGVSSRGVIVALADGRHLTPWHSRIHCVEKAMPPSGTPPKPITPKPRNRRLACMVKICRNQGECYWYWETHLHSLETFKLTLSGLLAQPRMRMLEKLNPRALTRTDEGECNWLWALHQPWLGVPAASNPLVKVRKPSPLSPSCWRPGYKTRPNADGRGYCGKASTCMSHRLRRCCRASVNETRTSSAARIWGATSDDLAAGGLVSIVWR